MLYGREREIAQLDTVLAECGNGRGRLILFAGEPGIGKTRLATSFAARAAAAGVRTFWGRCREEGGAPAHWPWVQILRALATDLEPGQLAAAIGRDAAIIATAVPEIADRIAPANRAGPTATTSRFAFFDAVQLFFANLTAECPLLLILDDLHAADASSLALLEFIAPDLERVRAVVLCTYREHEASVAEAGRVVARIARHGLRLRLSGLDVTQVAELADDTSGREVPRAIAAAIHSATEGNPLFVKEMVRALAAKGALAPGAAMAVELPDTVQHVIGARLQRLSAAARDALSAAAVIGRSFDIATLEGITGIAARELLTILQAAVEAGIARVPTGLRGESSFTHGLYREFFYGALTVPRRAELHNEVAAALERYDAQANLPMIAYHLLAAGPLGDAAKAVEYSTRAGDQAIARLAFAQAVVHYEDALAALRARGRDDARRCDLLLRLAAARFRAGAGESAKLAYREAADVARTLHDGERLASAALGLAGPWSIVVGCREEVVHFLEESLEALPTEHASSRARVLGRLSVELAGVDPIKQAELSEEALGLARGAGDAAARAETLLARHFALEGRRHGDAQQRRRRSELAREAALLARRLKDDELAFRARFCLIVDALRGGNAYALDGEIAAATRLAERLHQPFYTWFVTVWHALRAMIDGRFDEAERCIEDALALGLRTQGQEEAQLFAAQVHRNQRLLLGRDQGRGLLDCEPHVRLLAQRFGMPVLLCAVPWLRCDLGRWSDARDDFERLASDDFAAIPADETEPSSMAMLADVSADLGDEARARALYDRAISYDGEHVSNGALYLGAMAHYLGRLTATLGRVGEARDHFAAAERQHRRMGARCWVARTQFHWAEMLLKQPRDEDRARGATLLEEALERARRLGMAGLVAKAQRLRRGADAPVHSSERSGYVLRLFGEVWTVAFGGTSFQLKDQKGLRYLHHLLCNAGREVHVLDLMAAAGGHPDAGTKRTAARQHGVEPDGGSAPELLDRRALHAYRQRLRELSVEIATAEAHNDTGHLSRLRHEADLIDGELRHAARLDGRPRRLPDALERARLNVTRAIRTAQRQLGEHSPEMERHLARTIRTGQRCSYDPGTDSSIVWETSAPAQWVSPKKIVGLVLTLYQAGGGVLAGYVTDIMQCMV